MTTINYGRKVKKLRCADSGFSAFFTRDGTKHVSGTVVVDEHVTENVVAALKAQRVANQFRRLADIIEDQLT